MKNCPICGATYADELQYCAAEGAPLRAVVAADDPTGRILDDKYRVLRLLGAGGMGRVYLAEHVFLKRQCALKIVARDLLADDPEASVRFTREASNASRVDHPGIVAIYDFGALPDGTLYIAMEYVAGGTLADVVEAAGGLSPDRAVAMLRSMSEALTAAHALGIVHRDLKPENVLVGQMLDGREKVKIADFGIAKAIFDNDQRLTRTGAIVGTPVFMSPEQLAGETVDARTDVYSLALVAGYMLTAGLLLPAPSDPGWMLARMQGEVRPLAEVRLGLQLPDGVQEVFARALAPDREQRFQTTAAFTDALIAAFGRQLASPAAGIARADPAPAREADPRHSAPTEPLTSTPSASVPDTRVRRSRGGLSRRSIGAVVVGVILFAVYVKWGTMEPSSPVNGMADAQTRPVEASPPPSTAGQAAKPPQSRTPPTEKSVARDLAISTFARAIESPLAEPTKAARAVNGAFDSLRVLSTDEEADPSLVRSLFERAMTGAPHRDSVLALYYHARFLVAHDSSDEACAKLAKAVSMERETALGGQFKTLRGKLMCAEP